MQSFSFYFQLASPLPGTVVTLIIITGPKRIVASLDVRNAIWRLTYLLIHVNLTRLGSTKIGRFYQVECPFIGSVKDWVGPWPLCIANFAFMIANVLPSMVVLAGDVELSLA